MKLNNPYQYVFFNFVGKKIGQKKFDLDYWGLSYYQNLNYLLRYDNSSVIKVLNLSQTKLFYSLFSLTDKDRKRILEVTNIENADYLITNYYLDTTIYNSEFLNKNILINSIIVDNVAINSIYKVKKL